MDTGSGVAVNDGMPSHATRAEGGFPVRRPIVDYIIPLNVTTSNRFAGVGTDSRSQEVLSILLSVRLT
jgi:hypothetical protein